MRRAASRRTAFAALAAVLMAFSNGQAAAQSKGQDESLGRLFFTQQQRQELDRRRQLNIQEAQPVQPEIRYTLNGQVTRSSGRATTWVNGSALHDLYRSKDPARVPIQPGEGEATVQLKVGETLDRTRSEVTDALSGGSISVNPRPAKQP
jgi:hypothetical protein